MASVGFNLWREHARIRANGAVGKRLGAYLRGFARRVPKITPAAVVVDCVAWTNWSGNVRGAVSGVGGIRQAVQAKGNALPGIARCLQAVDAETVGKSRSKGIVMVAAGGADGTPRDAPIKELVVRAHLRRRVGAPVATAELWRRFVIVPAHAVGEVGNMGLVRMRGLVIPETSRQKLAASVVREPEHAPAVAGGVAGHLVRAKENVLLVR